MKTVVINIKTDKKTKEQAKKLAEDMGLNLSSVINGCLKSFIINRKITFDANPPEEPSDFMIEALRESEEDECSPAFSDARSAIAWLKDEGRKYESKVQKKVRQSTGQMPAKHKNVRHEKN